MPDPISWYTLGKEIGDPTTIDEEIDAKILEHNFDASAHGQSDEAVYNHRISEVLDHVNYAIYNIKLNPSTRPIKAFVDVGGAAEFSRISDAIAYVHELAGGRIFIKAGTYTLNTDLTMYSDIQFEGEDDELTIIDFNGDHKILVEGVWDNYKSNISFKNIQFKGYRGDNSKAIYLHYANDIEFEDCRFTDNHYLNFFNPSACVRTLDVMNLRILGCKVDMNDQLLYGVDTDFIKVSDCFFNTNIHYNIYLDGVTGVDISNNQVTQNEDYFLLYEAGAGQLTFQNNKFIENCNGIVWGNSIGGGIFTGNSFWYGMGTNDVFYFTGCGGIQIHNNTIDSPLNNGIFLSETSFCNISENYIHDGNIKGIVLDDFSCWLNMVNNNIAMSNADGDILDNGDSTVLDNNITS